MKKLIVAIFILSSLAGNAYAQTPAGANAQFQFKPIVAIPLPTGQVDAETTLPDYINGVFTLTIAIATILGVIMIVFSGFKYMTSDAVGGKKEAIAGIQGALFGLVLLLLSYLILNVINPQILALDALTKSLSALEGVSDRPETPGTAGTDGNTGASGTPGTSGTSGTAPATGSSEIPNNSLTFIPAGMELAQYTKGNPIPSGCNLMCSRGSLISAPEGTANVCTLGAFIVTLCPKRPAPTSGTQ